THSEPLDQFVKRYTHNEERFEKLLKKFSPTDLQEWCKKIGIETFVGSSQRVFPKEMSAGKFLLNWLEALKTFPNFNLHLKHQFKSISKDKVLTFISEKEEINISGDQIVLCLGGSSWKKTGSDGLWKTPLEAIGIQVNQFLPMNCGFEYQWSNFFKDKIDRSALKHVEITLNNHSAKGDLMLTPYGIEGGAIYAISNFIRDQLIESGKVTIFLDLRPGLSHEALLKKLGEKKQKTTLSNHLRKSLNLDKTTFLLLKEIMNDDEFSTMESIAQKIKNLNIDLTGIRPIDEAISTSGGVCFSQLSESLESKSIPGLFFAGEMLDYEAPTGGYLLQACFSTAWIVANNISSNRLGPS
ncbi:MAG: TIGR03862 family flavoprotein, partial [Halobacteriovoraceae bacterium]|nr:TIGR03862 family flavoprotein [Halobacteriovoraceae bacterium]